MLAVAFALGSAVLFGAMTVALRFGLRDGTGDPMLGAVVTTSIAALVAATAAFFSDGEPLTRNAAIFFLLAGLIAPGLSQPLFTWGVRDAGPSRTSVVVGTAPLFAAATAIVFLGEPIEAPLVVGGLLVVIAGVILVSDPGRPEHVRLAGIGLALAATLLFMTRDNLVRWYAEDSASGSVSAVTRPLLSRCHCQWPPEASIISTALPALSSRQCCVLPSESATLAHTWPVTGPLSACPTAGVSVVVVASSPAPSVHECNSPAWS